MKKTGKTVLILGNGFDLAHGLPTRYSDFLSFCKCTSLIYEFNDDKSYKNFKEFLNLSLLNDYFKSILCSVFINRENNLVDNITILDKTLNELYSYIYKNTWYNYFIKIYEEDRIKGENWIDFESEICYIIKTIDEYTKNIRYSYEMVYNEINDKKIEGLEKIKTFSSFLKKDNTIKDIHKNLYDDLRDLIKALEIYLSIVEQIPINKISDNIFSNYDYVINFNYTHTYRNVYSDCKNVFHIHGELNHIPNNMVLGIDEYWSDEEQDKHTNFTVFKKFAQRIINKTGTENYKYFDEIKKLYKSGGLIPEYIISKVYVYGHSLDITDKDVLFDFISSEATDVTIFYHDEVAESQLLSNAIKLIGEKRLLEKVNQYPPKIKFVHQKNMIERKDFDKSDNQEFATV